jgi:hypothetical protein
MVPRYEPVSLDFELTLSLRPAPTLLRDKLLWPPVKDDIDWLFRIIVLLGFLLWLLLGLCCAQEAVKDKSNTHINKEVSSVLRCAFRNLMP